MTVLEGAILKYEQDFFNVDFCCNKDNLENRLCVDFFEYGTSGKIHSREEIISSLLNMRENRDIIIYNFSALMLNENIIIAHYLSHEETTKKYALRTSIWKREETLWKMFFHQGTPASI